MVTQNTLCTHERKKVLSDNKKKHAVGASLALINALNISNNTDCSLRALAFLSYLLSYRSTTLQINLNGDSRGKEDLGVK